MRSVHDNSLAESAVVDPAWRIGVVCSSFYKEDVDVLFDGARKALVDAGIPEIHVRRIDAAGSFEIPLVGDVLARTETVDALIGLGIIVEGETHHARLIASEAARGIMDVQLRHHLPFVFEILYVDDIALARARLDKGAHAARSVLHSLATLRALRS